MIGGQFVASQLFHSPLESSIATIGSMLPTMFKHSAEADLALLSQNYSLIRYKLDPKDVIYFDRTMANIAKEIAEQGSNIAKNESYKKMREHMVAVCEIFKEHKIDKIDIEQLNRITLNLDSLFITYPFLVDTIKHYLMGILSADQTHNHRPQSLLLLGPSGVGKTHFMKELSQALNFDLIPINANELTGEDGFRYIYCSYSYDVNEFSAIARAIHKHNLSNDPGYLIILLDELDKQIQRNEAGEFDLNKTPLLYKDLLSLTDSNTKTYFDRTVNAHLNLSRVILAIVANEDFVRKTPLERRVKKITFPALTPKIKRQIANTRIRDLCMQNAITLTDTETRFLNNIISNDKLPGAGQLLDEIELFIRALKNASAFEQTSWKTSSKELLISFTRDMFQRRSLTWLEQIRNSKDEKDVSNKAVILKRRNSFIFCG